MLAMEAGNWLSYNDLAWTEPIISPPENYSEEVEMYCRVIRENAGLPVKTLLHLACGAGILDFAFKNHFKVTGVDISPGMLEVAAKLNPEITYHLADMRSVRLHETFDAVAIPDAIGYMTTREDLRKALHTACRHLKKGGVLLLAVHTKEEFRENNFAYAGVKDDIKITVFENNHISDPQGDTYEATIVYLIRRSGDLEIATDRHTIGLFALETWRRLLREELGLQVRELRLDHLYDANLLGEGEYPMTVFACLKT
jgi:SAM-dependent methyltransferase